MEIFLLFLPEELKEDRTVGSSSFSFQGLVALVHEQPLDITVP